MAGRCEEGLRQKKKAVRNRGRKALFLVYDEGRADDGGGSFLCPEVFMKFRIDRQDLPYDAMVPDSSWLYPIEEGGGENDADAEAEEIHTHAVHGEGQPV